MDKTNKKLGTIEILQQLVSIPSYVDGEHNESDLLNFIVTFIEENTELTVVKQRVENNRYNIIAFNKPNPKVALFGHTDTVLPKQETKNPFEARIEGNKLFGLGSVDMKAGLAIMMNIAQTVTSDDLALVFSVDEEYEFKGAEKLREFPDFHPEFIINVEPTDNKILNGCRGITEFSFTVHGVSAHAGRKSSGINAIEKSVELIKVFQDEISKLDNESSGLSTINLAYIHGGTLVESTEGSPRISGLGMVVPNYAELNCEIRVANKEIDQDFIRGKMNEIAQQLNISLGDFTFKFYLGSLLTPKSELQQFEQAVSNAGQKLEYGDISQAGFYEVQLLQETWGGNAVIYGPGPIGRSHMVDEYVELDTITAAENCLREYLKLEGVGTL